VDNIEMDLKETGMGGIDSIDLAQDSYQWRVLVNTVMNLRVPKNRPIGRCFEWLSDWQLHKENSVP
jgi:hypothetical protein